jgi:predicted anti-sigma-YlaC factor YlaD
MSALSARADGEDPRVDDRILDAHVAECPICNGFEASVDTMRRRVRVAPAAAMPDMSRQVVRATAASDRADHSGLVRGLLFITAVLIVVLSVPDLLGGDAAGARHLGAFCVAYAGGLLLVVARPARARTMFDVSIVLAVALVVMWIINIVQGRGPLVGDAAQIPDLISVGLLWLLTRPVPDPVAPAVDDTGMRLRVVSGDHDADPHDAA